MASALETEINWRSFEYYPPLTRVKSYTERNYNRDLPLKDAADVAGMEMTYFSSWFRQKVGIRYLDWVRYLRVSKAMSLLAKRDRLITDVAYAVGYRDLRTFERAFKKITGVTPRAFKKMCRPE